MFLKVILLSLMVICAEGNPLYSQQSNHAISSQSFHRQDVPLSYNYSSIHVYTTPEPDQHNSNPKNQLRPLNFQQNELDPIVFNRIQYAPIRLKGEERNYGQHSKVSIPTGINVATQDEYKESTKEEIRKDHLEPRNLTPNYFDMESQIHKFIPGHNVEVLQSLRSPGYDNHRSLSGYLEDNNSKKINNVHNHIVYRQPAAELQTTSATQTSLNKAVTTSQSQFIAVTPELIAFPNKISNVKITSNKILTEPYQPQHAMIQRLHLNVARVYNNAQKSEKASDSINPFIKSLNRVPSHTQAIIYNIPKTKQYNVESQQKTYLYPIQNDRRRHNAPSQYVFQ